MTSHTAFVSYAGGGRSWAKWIAAELAVLGIDVIMDVEQWRSGDSLQDKISEGIQRSNLFVSLINAEYFAAPHWSLDEFRAAYARHRTGDIDIIPLKIDAQAKMPPLYVDILTSELVGLTETSARHLVRVEIGKALEEDLRNYPTPTKRTLFPGKVLQGRPRFAADPEVERRVSASSQEALAFIKSQPTSPDPLLLQYWRQNAVDLSKAYAKEPPQAILDTALDLAREVRVSISVTTNPSHLGELHEIHGMFCGLLAYAVLDLGDAQAAYNHAMAVQFSAKQAEDHTMLAWGLGTQAMILRFNRDFDRSIQVASEGLGLNLSGPALARLHAQNSLGYSELRKEEETLGAIRLADEAMHSGDVRRPEEIGIFSFPLSKYHYYAGTAYLGLGRGFERKASRESEKAISRFKWGDIENQSYSDELLAHVHLATARVRSKELDGVMDALLPVFEAPAEYRTSWHYQWLERLIVHLGAKATLRNSTIARDIVVRFEEYKLDHPHIG